MQWVAPKDHKLRLILGEQPVGNVARAEGIKLSLVSAATFREPAIPGFGIFGDGGCHQFVVLPGVIMHDDFFEAPGDATPTINLLLGELGVDVV